MSRRKPIHGLVPGEKEEAGDLHTHDTEHSLVTDHVLQANGEQVMDFGGWKPIHGLVPGEKEAGSLHTHDRDHSLVTDHVLQVNGEAVMDFGGWKPIHGLVSGEKEEAGSLHIQDTEQVNKHNILFAHETKEENLNTLHKAGDKNL
jgi:hypothetical protein